jgi:hypothetical protein
MNLEIQLPIKSKMIMKKISHVRNPCNSPKLMKGYFEISGYPDVQETFYDYF